METTQAPRMEHLHGARCDPVGLTTQEASRALQVHGPNTLPTSAAPSFIQVLATQFLSPLIYILMAAAIASSLLSDITDSLFIAIVLIVNGLIGAVQEYSAGKSAEALKGLEQPHAMVIRDGKTASIDAANLVPGDLVLLETGGRVPADLRLISVNGLQCDEATHTGESMPVAKEEGAVALAGTIVARGRGCGVVTATGLKTELGRIAAAIRERSTAKPPLMIRLESFTRNIAVAASLAIAFLLVVGWLRSMPFADLLTMSIGLAVSAIPEALPIAISVALAIGMRRMAKVNVIVRDLPAVEALGSCTMIATDKTGTLTMNELTVTEIRLPDASRWVFEVGTDIMSGHVRCDGQNEFGPQAALSSVLRAATLPNEAQIDIETGEWKALGDSVDIALLAAAHKAGIDKPALMATLPLHRRIPYETEQKFAASLHKGDGRMHVFVKGAPDVLLGMCARMKGGRAAVPIDRELVVDQQRDMAAQGLRVLAFAEGELDIFDTGSVDQDVFFDLTFVGLVGMQDPIRPEVPAAIAACRTAGVDVVVVTGDDPKTAAAIARQAGMVFSDDAVASGAQVAAAAAIGSQNLDDLTRHACVYARVKPEQKLEIVRSLARNGHFVAVTGDGVNDAPALKHAHVGVAMGLSGTDVAKESANIILTDDNFASIVAGIREGRVAYANIRKVIYMLASTGAAEMLLFVLAMIFGLPLPMTAVQLLWLNLVTNGVQDVALVTEPAEGDELMRPARRPGEPIFDRLMIERVVAATLVMGVGGFMLFAGMLQTGMALPAAMNLLLLLFVLFENVQCFNSRSEHLSVFRQSLFSNPFLLLGVLGSQALHIGAMYVPGLNDLLGISPISLAEWFWLLLAAFSVLLVAEVGKLWRSRNRIP